MDRHVAVPDPLGGLALVFLPDAPPQGVVAELDYFAVGANHLRQHAGGVPRVAPFAAVGQQLLGEVALDIVRILGDAVLAPRFQQLAGGAVLAIAALVGAEQVANGVGHAQVDLAVGVGGGGQVAEAVVAELHRTGKGVDDHLQAVVRLPGVGLGADQFLP